MKIRELYEQGPVGSVGVIPVYDRREHPSNKPNVDKNTEIGAGFEAKVYAPKKHPGSVLKKMVIPADAVTDNSTVAFINLILQHQDNPFFPKIYYAKLFLTGPEMILFVNMEKLAELRSPKLQDAAQAAFANVGLDDVDLNIEGNKAVFNKFILSSDRKKAMKQITNDKLKEALNLLEPLLSYYNGDMHVGNWMLRLSSAGPHLVIIDPLQPL